MKMHGIQLRYASIFIAFTFVCLAGQGADQAQPADYSRGFARFYDLGLPVVTNAVYVKLDVWGNLHYSMRDFSLAELRLTGNAWMLNEDRTEGKGLFVMDNCRVVEVYDSNALLKKRAARLKDDLAKNKDQKISPVLNPWWNMINEDDGLAGRWKPVDPKKDIEKTIAFLRKKTAGGSSRHDSLDYSSGYGRLLLSAIHFHGMGFTNEANEIAGLLFDAAQDQRKVLAQGLAVLADAEYSEMANQFFISGDWQTYNKNMESLLASFSSSWDKAPAVKRLAERVKIRAGQAQPPAITGEGLTDEDRQLSIELAASTNLNQHIMMMGNRFWILPAASQRHIPASTNAIARIKARGIKSIPLLLAMIKDDYLTHLDARTLRGMTHYSFSGDERMTAERLDQIYDALQRPMSRSEIAIQLLEPLLKKDEQTRHSPGRVDRGEFYEQVKAWYAEHKQQSVDELAWFFMKEGDAEQRNAAVACLIEFGSETNQAAVEECLLKPEDAMRNVHLAQQYVTKRREKAADFVARYEAVLNKHFFSGESGDQMFRHEDSKAAAEKSLAFMKDMASGKPLDTMIEDIISGGKPFEEASSALFQVLATKKTDELLPLLIGAAVKAKTADIRVQFIQVALSIPYMRQANSMAAGGNLEEDKQALDISKTADLWKQVLADTRVTEGGYMHNEETTVADSAALAIELIYGEKRSFMDNRDFSVSFAPRFRPLIRARAEERLAGKKDNELTALPSADTVTREQRRKMVDDLMKAGDAELESRLAALSADSLLALADEANENEALNQKLGGLANRVSKLRVKIEQGEQPKELEAMRGKLLNKTMVAQLLAACRTFTENGMQARFCANRQAYMGGIEILADVTSATNKAAAARFFGGYMSFNEMKKPLLTGMFSCADQHVFAIWPVEQKKLSVADKKNAVSETNATDELLEDDLAEQTDKYLQESYYEQQEEFWKAVEEFCAESSKACSQASIQFYGMPAMPGDGKQKPGRRIYRHSIRNISF